jgi:sugar O-acyltransferase (sialic acid O-acetyltransferase NeuD family)
MGADLLDVYGAVREINDLKPTYDVLGYLGAGEQPPERSGGLKYLGPESLAPSMPEDVHFYAIKAGLRNYFLAEKWFQDMGIPSQRYETIVHPHAYVSPMCALGHGAVVMEGSVVPPGVTVGNHVSILRGVTLSHDNVIGDYSCLACGVSMSGRVKLEKFCWIATGAVIVDGAVIGEGSLIGSGSVIRHDVPPYEVWIGNPGRFLRKVDRIETTPK